MCNRTLGSDLAHTKFWHNCLPNEEQTEKPKISGIFQKLVYKKNYLSRQLTQWCKY